MYQSQPDIEIIQLSKDTLVYLLQPPCGSNTYIIKQGNRLLFVDCGFACYKEEMTKIFTSLLGNLEGFEKEIIITHADIDHTGLLNMFDKIYMSESCLENFLSEHRGEANFREQNVLHAPYCHLSKIISGYTPPPLDKCVVIGKKTDDRLLSHIGNVDFGNLSFDIYEGSGGHINGETVIVCDEYKIIFTGDIVVNAKGFSEKQKQFNLLAPYLMTSVNIDSGKAKKLREYITEKYTDYTLYPGHGTEILLK